MWRPNCWTQTNFDMNNEKEITPFCDADEIAKFKTFLATTIEDFRKAVGARNVEIIASVKESQNKCDLTIRF